MILPVADFRSSHFASDAYFSSAEFKSTTDFEIVTFWTAVPEFHATDIYDHTLFSDGDSDLKYWPIEKSNAAHNDDFKVRFKKEFGDDADIPSLMSAKNQKEAYNRLRLFMNKSLQTEKEQFFHRREMACKKELEGWGMKWIYWLYEKCSDYGYSVSQPAFLMLVTILSGALPFYIYFSLVIGSSDLQAARQALGLSISNCIAYLGFGRLYFKDVYTDLPWQYATIASCQTVIAVVLLVLFGLGLRSRFRLR